MATIGLDKLYYAKITEGTNGDETYAACVCQSKRLANVHQESQHLVDTRVTFNGGHLPPRG